ncbi:hypothetical protein [Tahibacter amnicola]|uniref:Yip1 domain-containing protein n=1 Tax=Tahibacter amnicola TaxID=2976241 RepID=A0ABY6BI71_9GAMM|nr:hypothetical protein [Tahibacter amnicola]UXI69043.1 hypothetical protein N4264_05145 [Tahibacter amnicola]
MRELFLIVRDILRFKRGPQDLPYAPNLVAIVVIVASALGVLEGQVPRKAEVSVYAIVFGDLYWLLVTYLLLQVRQVPERFVQTTLAFFITDALFVLARIPADLILAGVAPNATELAPGQAWAALLMLGLVIWQLCVKAHVFRHALNIPLAGGFLVALSCVAAQIILITALFANPKV